VDRPEEAGPCRCHQDVRRWRDDLAQRLRPASVNGALRVFRLVLTQAAEDHEIANPAASVKSLEEPEPYTEDHPGLLTEVELGRVLEAMRARTFQSYALTMTLGLTGMRKGEATALRPEDLDFDAGVIHVRRGQWRDLLGSPKGRGGQDGADGAGAGGGAPGAGGAAAGEQEGAARGVAVPGPEGRPHQAERPGAAAEGRPGGIGGLAGRCTVHGLRRSFNNALRKRASGIVTRAIVGHVSEEMTEHYSHVDRQEKADAAAEVARLVLGDDPSLREGSGGGSKAGERSASTNSAPSLVRGQGFEP
jgi:integrase